MEERRAQPDGPRVPGIKTIEQQVAPQHEDYPERKPGYDQGVAQITGSQPEDISKQNVVQMQVALHLRKNHEAKRKQPSEHHAHHRIFLHAAVGFDVAGGHRAKEPRGKRSHGQRQTDRVGDHDPRQHRVRDGIAHQRPAFEHQITREHRTHCADRDADDHRIDHERELKWLEQRGDHDGTSVAPAPNAAARRRARCPISPCFGAKTRAATNNALCKVTMQPPVEPSKK